MRVFPGGKVDYYRWHFLPFKIRYVLYNCKYPAVTYRISLAHEYQFKQYIRRVISCPCHVHQGVRLHYTIFLDLIVVSGLKPLTLSRVSNRLRLDGNSSLKGSSTKLDFVLNLGDFGCFPEFPTTSRNFRCFLVHLKEFLSGNLNR